MQMPLNSSVVLAPCGPDRAKPTACIHEAKIFQSSSVFMLKKNYLKMNIQTISEFNK